MLFQYKNSHFKKWLALILSSLLIIFSAATAYALNDDTHSRLSMQQLKEILKKSGMRNELQLVITPEILAQINNIRVSDEAREYVRASLQRMKQQKPIIEAELKKQNLPMDLLAIPLVESGYRALPASVSRRHSAGIWQLLPSTAQKYGLVVNDKQDDRLNIALETKAAVAYLKELHDEFHNWNLALLAYSRGEDNVHALIANTGTVDAWKLIRLHYGHYLQSVGAAVIIMHNPELIN